MFAKTAGMTSMVIDLITSERKTTKYMTERGVIRVTQTSMPEVHTGGEGDGGGVGGGWWVDRVEVIRAVTSVKNHPGTGVLHRKTTTVKFNRNWIFTSKTANRDKIFD